MGFERLGCVETLQQAVPACVMLSAGRADLHCNHISDTVKLLHQNELKLAVTAKQLQLRCESKCTPTAHDYLQQPDHGNAQAARVMHMYAQATSLRRCASLDANATGNTHCYCRGHTAVYHHRADLLFNLLKRMTTSAC